MYYMKYVHLDMKHLYFVNKISSIEYVDVTSRSYYLYNYCNIACKSIHHKNLFIYNSTRYTYTR